MQRREIIQYGLATVSLTSLPLPSLALGDSRPMRLKDGDTVALVAPATVTYEKLHLQLAIETIEAMGLKAQVGDHVMDRFGYLAGRDQDRADDLNEAFSDSNVNAIFALRGGWGASRILPLLDYDSIRANPKVLLGYSDITSLLNAIHAKTGMVTFHGPNVMSRWNKFTYSSMRDVIFEAKAVEYRNPVMVKDDLIARLYRSETIVPGVALGSLVGGSLTLISSLVGTPYLPSFKGRILFLEDVGEAIYRVDRMLTQLFLSGRMSQLSGIVFGHFTDVEPSPGLGNFALIDVLRQHCAPLGIPCYFGAMIGHVDKQSTLPIGAMAQMDASARTLQLTEPAVS